MKEPRSRLEELRIRLGRTLGDLATATNIPYGYLADLESDPALLPTLRLDRALILSAELGVSPSELMSESRTRPLSDAQVVFNLLLDHLPAALPMKVLQNSDWSSNRVDIAITACNEVLMRVGARLRIDGQEIKLAAIPTETGDLFEDFRSSGALTDAFGSLETSREIARFAIYEVSVPVGAVSAPIAEQLLDEGVLDRIGDDLWLSSAAIAALGLERQPGTVLAEQGFKARGWSAELANEVMLDSHPPS